MRGLVVAALLVGCTGEVDEPVAFGEPVRVPEGSFHPGELPVLAAGSRVTSIESASGVAVAGQRDRSFAGRTSDEAWAVGLRAADLGTGWWVVPVGDLDPLYPGERTFGLDYDIGGIVPPGLHKLRLAAIDEAGYRGPELDLELCVLDDAVADDVSVCDPAQSPPAIVIAAEWDRPVDLDLVVRTPTGKRVSWKAPTTADGTDGTVADDALDDPTVGRLTRDSNAGCLIDGRNAETVVWLEAPAAGVHAVYVDLFDACGASEVTFSAVVYRRQTRDDGTQFLAETDRGTGTLLSLAAQGGAIPPLFVLETQLP